MPKVIKIEDDRVLVGMDDGILKEITKDAFGFEPSIGQEIEIFENDTRTIVSKKEKEEPKKDLTTTNGININLSNSIESPAQVVSSATSKPTKVVNKVAYCLLALFLGGIGVHKFYAGKTGAGICYLLFCWTFIPVVLSLIDLIVGLCKHADGNGNISV